VIQKPSGMCLYILCSLAETELTTLNVNLSEAPHWLSMMTAFQQAASAQSGTSEFVPLRLRPNDAIHLYLLF